MSFAVACVAPINMSNFVLHFTVQIYEFHILFAKQTAVKNPEL